MRLIRRRRMLSVAASVKVRARIEEGSVSVLFRILAMRVVRTWVLPVPGPAMTITGPSRVSTARC